MAWFHGSLKILENGKYIGKVYWTQWPLFSLSTLNYPCFEYLSCRCFRLDVFWSLGAPSGPCLTDAVTLSLILYFCIDLPFQVSIYQDNCIFYVSNFCLDRPFGSSVHRDAHFCLSRFLMFTTYRAFLTKYFLIASAFIGHAGLPPSIVVKVIAHEPS